MGFICKALKIKIRKNTRAKIIVGDYIKEGFHIYGLEFKQTISFALLQLHFEILEVKITIYKNLLKYVPQYKNIGKILREKIKRRYNC